MTLRRRDGRVIFWSVTVGYLIVYLWAIGHLAPGLGGYGVHVVAEPVANVFRADLGPFMFTPIAIVRVGLVTYLFSFNTALGLGLAVLVGLNFALSFLACTQPKACGIKRSSSGVLASVPALLSGAACCGPVVLIVTGIQASTALITFFQLLLPLAALVLVGSLILMARQIDPKTG
jgi:hypothetical protein